MFGFEYFLAIQATHPYLWRNDDHSTQLDDRVGLRPVHRPERVSDNSRRRSPRSERSGSRFSAAMESVARSRPAWIWRSRTGS